MLFYSNLPQRSTEQEVHGGNSRRIHIILSFAIKNRKRSPNARVIPRGGGPAAQAIRSRPSTIYLMRRGNAHGRVQGREGATRTLPPLALHDNLCRPAARRPPPVGEGKCFFLPAASKRAEREGAPCRMTKAENFLTCPSFRAGLCYNTGNTPAAGKEKQDVSDRIFSL